MEDYANNESSSEDSTSEMILQYNQKVRLRHEDHLLNLAFN